MSDHTDEMYLPTGTSTEAACEHCEKSLENIEGFWDKVNARQNITCPACGAINSVESDCQYNTQTEEPITGFIVTLVKEGKAFMHKG